MPRRKSNFGRRIIEDIEFMGPEVQVDYQEEVAAGRYPEMGSRNIAEWAPYGLMDANLDGKPVWGGITPSYRPGFQWKVEFSNPNQQQSEINLPRITYYFDTPWLLPGHRLSDSVVGNVFTPSDINMQQYDEDETPSKRRRTHFGPRGGQYIIKNGQKRYI